MDARAHQIRKRSRPVAATVAGALALAGAVALLWPGSPDYEVTAVFDQVNGLVPGADVEVAGVRIGSVESIDLGSDGLPHVRLGIDGGLRLRQGAVADLRMASASGEANSFIALTQGHGPPLADGSTLGLARTDQPVEIGQVLSTLDGPARANVRAALAGLDRASGGGGTEIARTLRHSAAALGNAGEAVRQVDGDGAALRALVSSGRQVLDTLASDPGTLGSTADRLAAVLQTAAGHQADLARATAALPAGLGAPRAALERLDGSIGTLQGLVADAGPGVARLEAFSRALRPAMKAARPAVHEASGLVADAPSDLSGLGTLLQPADRTLGVMTPVLRSAGPILNEARVRTPDFFSFFSNWADFTSVYDANGHAARVGLVLPPAADNTIGPSDDGSGSLQAPFVRTPGVLEGDPWTNYRNSFIGGGDAP